MAAKSLDWKAVVKSTGLRLVVMMVGLYLVSGILEPNYLQPSHIMSTLVLCCFWGIICIGQTLIILTGGAARFVEPLVLHPHIYDPNLLLKGLAFLCERNCAN